MYAIQKFLSLAILELIFEFNLVIFILFIGIPDVKVCDKYVVE